MPSPSHRSQKSSALRRLPVVGGTLLVLALAAPVVASVVQPEVTTARDPQPQSADVDRATDAAGGPSTTRMTAAASPDRLLRQQRLERIARREAREARAREQARRERLHELAEQRARERARKRAAARARSAPISFRIGSFNVLGSQHTAPGGSRRRYPPASTRTAGAAGLVAGHGVDVLGTQELQADQLRDLQNRTGMAAWPGFGWGEAETDNSILYDPGVFEVVSGRSFTIPFMGRPRPQPIVRLRHRDTGRELYVVNTHPSAGGGSYLAERRRGQAALVGVVNDLKSEGLPVLVTGDMNDREEFYCRVAPPAGLVAPNGGSYSGGCRPPPSPLPVDWVIGSGVTWSGYWRDTTPVNRRISDHFFISALVHVGG